jgi:putative transposase
MPRSPRADEAGGLYHALNRANLNRANLRATIFKKAEDYLAFEKILCRYVERNALRAELVDRAEDWRWGSLWRWQQRPEPDPRLLSPWPLARLPWWIDRVNEPLSKQEFDAAGLSAQRGRPLGDEGWVESIARRLDLESTMRPRGRPRVRFSKDQANKEA